MSPKGSTVLAAALGLGLATLVTSCGTSAGSASIVPVAQSYQPVPSPGCRSRGTLPGQSTLRFSTLGKSGTYIQDVPPAGGSSQPLAMVMDLHGYVEPASFEHLGTGLGSFGDSHGFVTITPQLNESGPARWDYGARSSDIAYLSGLLTHVERALCLDERRVYVTGLSMGAFTTSAIACQLSGRVAAVAPVAGLQAFSWCRPARPVPVVAFHGTADPYVAYTGGPGPNVANLPALDDPNLTIGQEIASGRVSTKGAPLPQSIPAQVADWARRNGCGRHPVSTPVASDVTLISYPCAHDASVELYRVFGGGHTWPGGTPGVYPEPLVGRTTTSIIANQIMWAFFQAHPLPGRPA